MGGNDGIAGYGGLDTEKLYLFLFILFFSIFILSLIYIIYLKYKIYKLEQLNNKEALNQEE